MKKTLNFSVIWIKFSAFVINEREKKKKKKRKKEREKEREKERKKERKFIIAWQLVKSSPYLIFFGTMKTKLGMYTRCVSLMGTSS